MDMWITARCGTVIRIWYVFAAEYSNARITFAANASHTRSLSFPSASAGIESTNLFDAKSVYLSWEKMGPNSIWARGVRDFPKRRAARGIKKLSPSSPQFHDLLLS